MSQKVTSFDRPLVLAISESYSVLYAGWGNPPPGAVKEESTLITGEIAEWLYEALAGHIFGEHPENALASRARVRRHFINRRFKNMGVSPTCHQASAMMLLFLAQAVLIQHKNVMLPWLGVTRLNERGNPVLDAPEYTPVQICKQ